MTYGDATFDMGLAEVDAFREAASTPDLGMTTVRIVIHKFLRDFGTVRYYTRTGDGIPDDGSAQDGVVLRETPIRR